MAKLIKAEKYFAKHPNPVILQFQPEHVEVYKTPKELAKWESLVRERVGLPVTPIQGETYTGTTKTENGIRYFDDCDE